MAAAAIGNTISDGAGIWSGQWLESKCKVLGFEEPKLTDAQQELPVTIRWRNVGPRHCVAPYFGLRPVAFCRQYSALIFSEPQPFPACSFWNWFQEFICETLLQLSPAAALTTVPDRVDIPNALASAASSP
ncbi:unnamed protein product [Cladocopium goreaui]|uniref:Transmembrane protein 65 n=1 Tax=Cladocopium goreaui TaxID=2562237 RepID=A0A9P1FMW6_9DINO|nr:unnamed protein product [Cladocopium goreaui]